MDQVWPSLAKSDVSDGSDGSDRSDESDMLDGADKIATTKN